MDSRNQTVLIVDDTPATIEILGEILGAEQETIFATSGPEALDIARDQQPDLILLDVLMPDMDGYEVLAKLKADPRTRAIPVIFITAMDRDEDEAKGLEAGAIDYITKPVNPVIVKARVHNHLELKRYRDYLENLSATDGLTGISNRRHFDDVLDSEWRRSRRAQTPLSLVLMDIDYFKAYNDHYGHLAGDDCLRKLAKAFVEMSQRAADTVARYGGEEFGCILPGTGIEGALCVAQKIRHRVSQLAIPHETSSVASVVTLSIGVSTLIPLPGQLQWDLIKKADEALYEVKRSGRNQIRSRPE